jgi:ParB/RepB/Spo0J family partition protein
MVNSKNHIVMIRREQLHPHPDNPRKDLGDLEELRESIKEHGIMQNLTVVPDKDGYKILIGHRRFAASEGILEELPCVISEGLTDREQVGIMLCENMQRSDLTVFEQAHGFQMMLDLGDTVEVISQKTGFSKQTIKHRLEISKLDKKAIDIKTKQDIKSLGDDFEDYPMIKKLLLNVWAALASSYANKFVEWNFTKNMKVLKAHHSFAKILKHFGLKLHEEPQAIIDGTSDFYTVKL